MESSSSKHFVTFFLTTLISISSYTYSISAARDIPTSKTNIEFIRKSCVGTTYPKLCFSALASHASTIQSRPQLIASTALGVTISSAKTTSTMMFNLSLSHGLKPKEVDAMKDCIEELSDSVDELRRSMVELSQVVKGGPKFMLMINDIQTWVSAALTDETTCTDGFEGNEMNGNLKTTVRARIVNVAQLTSNALALINKYALIHG
ncbi:Pectinesterase inhibitor domain containing protein [Parasponia andersonii]|uniref:Pectinesterase inhibitor domain containing protein n=1 Tax=Parasponia andersonii TaxID=3476 RepID=A0A2P5C5D5_PARAD|nr:Pectinesterase inhibitor domain containing protein [Parasponia andersonii]